MRATISTKGQIILPAELRKRDHITAGRSSRSSASDLEALHHGFTVAT